MRSSKSRSRNKSNRQRSIGNIINRVFDSSGPEGKVRGTPQQIIEKYLALARDAQLGNDRVAEQNFLQHAEHYTRLLGEAQRELAREQEERSRSFQQGGQTGGNGGNGQGGYRERPEREPRDPAPEAPRFEEARYEGAPVMMPDFFAAEEEGSGLVETPEARQAEPRPSEPRSHGSHRAPREPREPRKSEAAPAATEAAQAAETGEAPKPEKTSRSRSSAPRKPKPKAEDGEKPEKAPKAKSEKAAAPQPEVPPVE